MALSPNEGLKLPKAGMMQFDQFYVGMALSPNEGLKQEHRFQLQHVKDVGMALSPNEGLKQVNHLLCAILDPGRNGAKPE